MATPKLALIPTGYKAGKLYSVLPESGVGDFTVVRATEATRVNEEGLIETMGANVPRLDYSGGGCPVLLTEPQRTNLVTQSELFSDAVWLTPGASVTSGFVSPDGTLNAFKFFEDTSTGGHYARTSNIGVTLGDDTTFSVFIKKGESNFIQLLFSGASHSSSNYANFDLLNGVLGSVGGGVAKIEFIGGFYRCSFTSQATATTATNAYIWKIQSATSPRAESYTGDGTSGVYIYGASLEQASYPSSYIKTEGSAVTRNADLVNGAGDAATFNDSEGVLMAEISALADDLTNRIISLSDGTNTNIISVQFSNAQSNDIVAYYNATGQTGRVISTTSYNIKSFNKTALVWTNSSFKFYVNGYLIGIATIETPLVDNTLNQLKFQYGNSTLPFYGNTSQIKYFNTALNDSELETLTSWTSFIEMAQAQNYNII